MVKLHFWAMLHICPMWPCTKIFVCVWQQFSDGYWWIQKFAMDKKTMEKWMKWLKCQWKAIVIYDSLGQNMRQSKKNCNPCNCCLRALRMDEGMSMTHSFVGVISPLSLEFYLLPMCNWNTSLHFRLVETQTEFNLIDWIQSN